MAILLGLTGCQALFTARDLEDATPPAQDVQRRPRPWLLDAATRCEVFNLDPTRSDAVVRQGDCVERRASGWGKATWFAAGEPTLTYEGDWMNGRPSGEGTLQWSFGDRCKGTFSNGNLSGKTYCVYNNGSTFTGDFQDGAKSGHGVFVWADGDEYSGEFLNGIIHGQGTYTSKDGERYTGAYVNSKRQGYGMLVLPEGRTYQGNFVQGQPDETGLWTESEQPVVAKAELRDRTVAVPAPTSTAREPVDSPQRRAEVARAERAKQARIAKEARLAEATRRRQETQQLEAAARARRYDERERQREARRVDTERRAEEAEARRADLAQRRQAEADRRAELAEARRVALERKRLEMAQRREDGKTQRDTARRPPAAPPSPGTSEPDAASDPVRSVVAVTNGNGLPVMDFCATQTAQGSTRYVKSKLLMFNMRGLEKVEAPERVVDKAGKDAGTRTVLASIDARNVFTQVWWSTFAMRRFYNIVAPTTAPEAFLTNLQLSLTEVQAAFKGDAQEEFLSRSAACADYIAVPDLESFEAVWRQGERKKKVNKQEITVQTWSLHLKPAVQLVVFRRTDEGFERVERVEASASGLFDFVTDLGAATQKVASLGSKVSGKALRAQVGDYREKLVQIRKQVELLRDATRLLRAQLELGDGATEIVEAELREKAAMLVDLEGQIDLMVDLVENPTDTAMNMARAKEGGWAGLVSGFPASGGCEGEPGSAAYRCADTTFWLPERESGVAGMTQRSGEACAAVNDEDPQSVAPCEVRVRAENIGLLAREQSQGIEGWRLYAPLQTAMRALADGGPPLPGPGISLGDEEGVRRGAIFWAVEEKSGQREHLGFARVVKPGPGGQLGLIDPSLLTWRAGGAELGTRMEEHPQIGVAFTVSGGVTTGLSVSDDPFITPLVKAGGLLGGLSLGVGYDLTGYTDWSWGELWLRTNLQLAGTSVARPNIENHPEIGELNYFILNPLVGSELKIYLLSRLDLTLTALGGVSFVSVSTPDHKITVGDKAEQQDDSGSGASWGVVWLGTGLDFVLHPDWLLRVNGGYRQNLFDIALTPPDDVQGESSIFNGQNIGTVSGAEFNGGVTYIF